MTGDEIREAMHVIGSVGDVPIRVASRKDFATFGALFRGLVIDQARRGGQIAAEERTFAALYGPLFCAYVSGERPGVCLLAGLTEPLGVLLWGAPLVPEAITLRDGPVAQGWGVYVAPAVRGTGISRALREHGARLLREQGFRRVTGTAVLPESVRKAVQEARPQEAAALESALGAGFVWEEVSGSLYLEEKA